MSREEIEENLRERGWAGEIYKQTALQHGYQIDEAEWPEVLTRAEIEKKVSEKDYEKPIKRKTWKAILAHYPHNPAEWDDILKPRAVTVAK